MLTVDRSHGSDEPEPAPPLAGGDAPRPLDDRDRRRIRRAVQFGIAAGFVPMLCLLWDFGLRPLRTAGAHRFGSNFYDLQARAFLDGDLAVPADSLGIEGFVLHGRTYMYFPPFPALLRVPVLMLTDRFDGRLTAPSMLIAWAVLAGATAVLVWNIRLLVRPHAPIERAEAVAAAIFIAAVTGGSIVLFLAALPWVYHEVYLWAGALTVTVLAALVTYARTGALRAIAVCAVGVIAVILTRTTSGWAMAFTVIVTGLVVAFRTPRRGHGAALIAAGLVAVVVSSALNWAKFRNVYMFPLQDQVWTQVNSRRRLALLMNDGDITGPQFFLTSLVNYFRPNGIRFVSYFPFVTLPARPARSYGGAFLDQVYRTGSVPAFTPVLFLTACWGFVVAFGRRAASGLRALRLPLLGALAITVGVMGYGYVANRYTAEFLPVLVIGAAVGTMDLASRTSTWPRPQRRTLLAALAGLALFGVLANGAAGLAAERLTWRGDRLEHYVDVQRRASAWLGGTADQLVERYDALPATAPTDTLGIVGDCDALYVSSGDEYEPWVTVQVRDLEVMIDIGPDVRAGALPLVRVTGAHDRSIALEVTDHGHARLRLGEGLTYLPTEWIPIRNGDRLHLRLHAETERDRFSVQLGDDLHEYVAAAEWDREWHFVVARATIALASPDAQAAAGVTLTPSPGPRLELCDRLLARAR